MTKDEIQAEWDTFIEYPDNSDKLFVTTTSALLFAKHIASKAVKAERKACAQVCVDLVVFSECAAESDTIWKCAEALRARNET